MKTEIEKIDVDWLEIKNACRQTIDLGNSDKEPNEEWKIKLLIARHSPIRLGEIKWRWEGIPTYVSTHFARHHEGCEKFIASQRNDRCKDGIDRANKSQVEPVNMKMMANLESLISIAEKRLCMCADKTTIEYMRDLVEEIRKYDENIAWRLVPQCINYGACIEKFGSCKFFENFAKDLTKEELIDIRTRIDKYNEYIGKQRILKK